MATITSGAKKRSVRGVPGRAAPVFMISIGLSVKEWVLGRDGNRDSQQDFVKITQNFHLH